MCFEGLLGKKIRNICNAKCFYNPYETCNDANANTKTDMFDWT